MVEWLKPSEGPTLRSCVRHMFISLRTLAASTLPSSTPHWSNELMPQMKPCAGHEAPLDSSHNAFASLYSLPHLAQLHAPLVKGVDAPDEALRGTGGLFEHQVQCLCSTTSPLTSCCLHAPQVKGVAALFEAQHHGQQS